MKKILVGLLILSTSPAFAESYIKACGVVKYETTYQHGSEELRYAVYAEGYRFEIQYLEDEQVEKLEKLKEKAGDEKVMGACVKGRFGGTFSWSGFDTGGVELTRLKAYKDEDSVYVFYKNYDR